MMDFYHGPQSRSTSVLTLLDELGALGQTQIHIVNIKRGDGTGAADPANPHPEGKVPYLVDGAEHIRERGAIFAYLTDKFPQAGLGPQVGEAGRGAYLSWLAYYQGVVEPVLVAQFLNIDNDQWRSTFRGKEEIGARIAEALAKGPWLLGERYSAADLLLASPFVWYPPFMLDVPAIHDWVERVKARPAQARTMKMEQDWRETV
jgi:glutathione S-transferase